MVGDGQLASDLDSAPKSEPKRTGIFLAHAVPGGVGRTGAGTGDLGPGGGSAVTGRADGGGSGIGAPGGQGSGVGGLGDGSGHIARAGVPGPDGGLADLLRVIRRRIEEAKVYPDSARRAGLQGTAELQFRIGPDGAPQGLEIVRSSGHVELDEVSRQTILRAGPYPVVRGRIRIPLSYRLDR